MMGRARVQRRSTRRQFITRAGTLAASLAAGAAVWPNFNRRAEGAPSLKGTGEVVVYDGGGAWGHAVEEAYFKPFQQATGIKVVPNVEQAPAAKIKAGILAGVPGYDVTDITGGDLQQFIDGNLLLPIDYSYWDPADVAAFKPVPTNKYHVCALFFSLVIAYDPKKFGSSPPKTWADFWDTKKFPGQRSLGPGDWASGSGTWEVALMADGVPPNHLYPLDLDRALRALTRLKPSIAKFWQSGAEGPQLLNDGEVSMTTAWNGRVSDLRAQGGNIADTWNQGLLQWDSWAVPKGAKNVENAMKFIAFASQPGPQAKFAELIAYGPPNSRAYQSLSKERIAVLPTAPAIRELQVVQNYTWWNSKAPNGKTYCENVVGLWQKWVTGTK